MNFKNLSEYFKKIEETPSRLEMTRLLAELFNKIHADEIDKVIYLLQGRLCPTFTKLDFGLGEKMILRAAARSLNIEAKHFMNSYNKIGDIGKTVEEFKKDIMTIGERDMTIVEVFTMLEKIAHASGDGSQEVKIGVLSELIQTLDPLSTRYVVRIPAGTLRLGFSDMTMLDSFSWMVAGNKSLRPTLEKAYQVRPDLGYLGKRIKAKGVQNIDDIEPEVFTPIIMMKAQRLSTIGEIVEKIGESIIEPKYDGFRLQVHYRNHNKQKTVKLFSRSLEDVTYMYPDIVEGVKKEIKAKEIIFEGEAIGFDPYTGNFLPFQQTVQRKRKYDIEEKAQEIPLRMFAFELLFLNGTSCINKPFSERLTTLRKLIKISGDIFKDTLLPTEERKANDKKVIEKMFEEAVSRGLEGIMIKKLDGRYQPGARGWNWIKYKRTHSNKVTDTFDCLVMGYDYGKGDRAKFGIGAFLVGVYDDKSDTFKTVAKVGSGPTEEEWKDIKKRLDRFQTKNKPALYEVHKNTQSDIWVKPSIVVEIQADEITVSPMHSSGYALRFPRLKGMRDDKKPQDATTVSELLEIAKPQK
ncbi:hypothetical protein A2957_03365 [Candidatus Roizmanbacteria bacterium RIFCSPLOWO2_01_FULL_38_11]|uniref:Probable DNA ligase n=1 Tax=Candidatus Roizmanbacteria bacterium RIFCSPLOWO2_01_FULL_38_11 TaxID=1802060 RepID=A0A1F7IP85_9BACT|nr:MAG: hypothetical protein A2957_03365 [Candidatus Roizmanbacteria bacterium RIFCSPLOWO2_01_FULL_38_11]